MFLIIIILAIIDLSLQWHNSYISITEIHLAFKRLFPLAWGLWEASQFLFVLGLTAYFFLDCTNFPLYLHTSSTCIAVAVTYCLNFQFSSVVSDSLRLHESQHARPPCPSPTPGVYSNSCPSSQWCHPAISSSVAPFSSCPQSLPASGSFLMSQLFTWGGQSIGVSTSASVLPMKQKLEPDMEQQTGSR